MTTAFDIAKVRADFPILHQNVHGDKPLVYLDSGASSQKPRCVIDKLTECYEQYNSNVHRGIHALGDRMTQEMEAAREKVQQFLGAQSPDEIIFTGGTTASVNIVAAGWAKPRLQPGDEILVTLLEHHANIVPWQMAAKAAGATVRFLPLTPDGLLDLSQLDEFLTRKTKVLAITGMSNVLGTIPPVRELIKRAKDVGAIVVLDAAQSIAHGNINVRELDVDFLAFSAHKVFGPTGIGILYGKRERLEETEPLFGGGHMIREVTTDGCTWADLPAKLEAGTAPFVETTGLGVAIDYLQSLGIDNVTAHEHALLARAHERLTAIDGLHLYGPDIEHKGPICSFTVDGVHAHDLSDLLDRQGVAVRAGHHCTMPLHDWLGVAATARASFAVYNTLEEVDILADAILKAKEIFSRPRTRRRASPDHPV